MNRFLSLVVAGTIALTVVGCASEASDEGRSPDESTEVKVDPQVDGVEQQDLCASAITRLNYMRGRVYPVEMMERAYDMVWASCY